MEVITKPKTFKEARDYLRKIFNILTSLIREGKAGDKVAQRGRYFNGEDFSDSMKGYGTQWQAQSTLIAAALAHSRKHIHIHDMSVNNRYYPGQQKSFYSLDVQRTFITDMLEKFNKAYSYMMTPEVTESIKLVAFTEFPAHVCSVQLVLEEVLVPV